MGQMMRFLASADEVMSLGEKLAVGTEVALMGIAIVFFVLAILWGCLELFRVIFYEIPKKREEKKKAQTAIEKTEESEILPNPMPAAEDEGQILAAITAAVALVTERQPGTFRVVSFRRSDKQPKR